MAVNQNQALFSLLGTMYGGDGRSTFGLPDCRGRSFMGYNPSSPVYQRTIIGEVGGREDVTLDIAHMPSHHHDAEFYLNPSSGVSVMVVDDAADNRSPNGNYLASGRDSSDQRVKLYSTSAPTAGLGGVELSVSGTVTVDNRGGSVPFSILPPFQAMNYVISLQGIFPPRS